MPPSRESTSSRSSPEASARSGEDEESEPNTESPQQPGTHLSTADQCGDLSTGLRGQCFQGGAQIQAMILLGTCILALVLVGFGSWSCSLAKGENPSSSFGIWTLEDTNGKCQLWSVLLYSYDLGSSLYVAQLFSSCSMVLGLTLLTFVAQITQMHIASWVVGLTFFLTFIVSVSTTNIFNLWVGFWGLTYIVLIRFVGYASCRNTPPRRQMFVASAFLLNSIFTALPLIVFKSRFCNCNKSEQVEERIPCEEKCRLGAAGYCIVAASILLFLGGVITSFQSRAQEETCVRTGSTQRPNISNSFLAVVVVPVESTPVRVDDLGPLKSQTCVNEQGSCGRADIQAGDEEDGGGASVTKGLGRRMCGFGNNSDLIRPTRERISCKERCGIWLCGVFWASFVTLYIFLIVLLIGTKVENVRAARAPDTTSNFVTNVVCAFNPSDSLEPFVSFPLSWDAHEAGYMVAHCGECGFCSNMKDIQIYVETRGTIAESAKKCAAAALLGKYDGLVNCLEDRIDFTRPCTECWADNMKTTAQNCLFTCMSALFTGFMDNNNVEGASVKGWLNQCLQCDEKMSGNDFVNCSGVARRRLGIRSEIERDPEEQCESVDLDWVQVFGDGTNQEGGFEFP